MALGTLLVRPDQKPGSRDDEDAERRRALRAFLIESRSRLRPGDVELPEAGPRRVPGLRRTEVAELVGVSTDWYRRFESGRPVRPSPQLVARIAKALRLKPRDELTLFRLALPELYVAHKTLQRCG